MKFRDPCSNRFGEIRPKAIGCCIFEHLCNFDKCRLEVACDVISGVAVDKVGLGVYARFGDSRLNSSRIIRVIALPDPFFAHFCAVFNCLLQPTGSR